MHSHTTPGQHSGEVAHPRRGGGERCGLIHPVRHGRHVVEETGNLLGTEHQMSCRNEMVGGSACPTKIIVAGRDRSRRHQQQRRSILESIPGQVGHRSGVQATGELNTGSPANSAHPAGDGTGERLRQDVGAICERLDRGRWCPARRVPGNIVLHRQAMTSRDHPDTLEWAQ